MTAHPDETVAPHETAASLARAILDDAYWRNQTTADTHVRAVRLARLVIAEADAVDQAVKELDAEHRPFDLNGMQSGCVLCWPKDGSWPCTSRMIADDLRAAVTGDAVPDA